jgi:hypothetical protein
MSSDRTITESTGPHLGHGQQRTRATVRETLENTSSLHHLSHYTGSDWDFSVDVTPQPPESYHGEHARRYQAVGCNLVAKLTLLNNQLSDVGTGALIRTVLHAEDGVIYSNTVMQRERILGVTKGRLGPPSPKNLMVNEADQAVADLVTRLRATFGQVTQDPGGYLYLAQHPEIATWSAPDLAGAASTEGYRSALHPDDLQFVALVRRGTVEHAEDLFDHAEMEDFFRAGYTTTLRRRFYTAFAPELEFHVRDLSRIVHPLIGRGVNRVVLDVQRGAVYFYRLDSDTYLVGVTLNQFKVTLADMKMEWLCRLQADH